MMSQPDSTDDRSPELVQFLPLARTALDRHVHNQGASAACREPPRVPVCRAAFILGSL
jgi:hypothetical protein